MVDEIYRPLPFPPPVEIPGDTPQQRETLPWSYDECNNAVLGFVERPSEFRPCEEPFPCGDLSYEPGMLEAVTVHPMRAFDKTTDGVPKDLENKELCRYHFAIGLAMRSNGLLQPVLCVRQDARDLVHQPETNPDVRPRTTLCLGAFFVAQDEGPRAITEAGFLYGVVGVPNPPWMAAIFEANQRFCTALE